MVVAVAEVVVGAFAVAVTVEDGVAVALSMMTMMTMMMMTKMLLIVFV